MLLRFTLRCWRLWTLCDCLEWHAFSVSQGLGLSLRSGKLGWWFQFSKRGTGGCAVIIRVSHYSASRRKFTFGCWKGGFGWSSNFGFRNSSVVLVLAMELWASSLPFHACVHILNIKSSISSVSVGEAAISCRFCSWFLWILVAGLSLKYRAWYQPECTGRTDKYNCYKDWAVYFHNQYPTERKHIHC